MKIFAFWWEFLMTHFIYLLLIIPGIILFYPAYFIRYELKTYSHWLDIFLNDETDFGEQWWLDREGLDASFKSAILWWWRNPVWNFWKYFEPANHANTKVVKIYAKEGDGHVLRWCIRDKAQYGFKHVYYEASGILYGRLSFADEHSEIMLGASGKRYPLRLKNWGHLLKLLIKLIMNKLRTKLTQIKNLIKLIKNE